MPKKNMPATIFSHPPKDCKNVSESSNNAGYLFERMCQLPHNDMSLNVVEGECGGNKVKLEVSKKV